MAKNRGKNKNKFRGGNGNHGNQTKTNPGGVAKPAPKSNPGEKIEDLVSKAESTATVEDLDSLAEAPPEKLELSLEQILARGNETLQLLDVQRKRYEASEGKIKKQEEALLAREEELEQLQKQICEKESELQPQIDQLTTREIELVQREEAIVKREADADSGFLQRNNEALESLDSELKDLTKDLTKHRSKMLKEREALEEDKNTFAEEKRSTLDNIRKQGESEIESERDLLSKQYEDKEKVLRILEEEIKGREAILRKDERKVALDRELLVEDKDAAEDRAQSLVAGVLEKKEFKIKDLEDRLEAARIEHYRLEKVIFDFEEADKKFGDKSLQEILDEIKTLRGERDTLKKTLGSRPSEDSAQRLTDLERERETWEKERLQFKDEVSDLKNDLNNKRIAVVELETLRNHKSALEASNDLLTKALEEEIRKVQDLVRGPDGKSPFPSCAEMDSKSNYQSPRPTHDTISDLSNFAEYVRHRMAFDPQTGKNLYYSQKDVRSLIGGLAMSRLHLLQGISGTGKTSLPKAFARAIGAGSSVIEVQAGWRDRQDLIGHFNAFEGRFYESEFLLALYKASCPQYKDSPFVVVLDEMNLSHPEQYFADLLSALEQDIQNQQLVLMSSAVESSPSLFNEGRILPLPQNVWFVGTANHDETTKDFADKTYDRAHVMELPRHNESFEYEEIQAQNPISMSALQGAFNLAKDRFGKESKASYQFLKERLGDDLGRRFRVGWGNRLERQMENYVPVVVAAGGSVGEATDHILATKLLSKIRDRHDNRPDDIIALRDLINVEWTAFDKNVLPVKSLEILGEELHRLGHVED